MSETAAKNVAKVATENASKFTEKASNFLKTPMGIGIQIVIGLLVSFLIYWISLKILRTDALNSAKVDTNAKTQVSIVTGYADSSQLAKQSFNTINAFASGYLPLSPSVNIKGGAQFTYSMWMFVGQTTSTAGKSIFMRGDHTKYFYNISKTSSTNPTTPTAVKDYVAMCPLLEFGTNAMDFNVRFNTSNNINEVLAIKGTSTDNSIYRKNLMAMLVSQWFMMTIVFEDNVPINDFENGLAVKVYINGILYQSGTYAAMLKQNTGNMFLFPDGSIDKVKISSFIYYNYALGEQEIQANMGKGPSSTAQSSVAQSFMQPLALSDYNIMDIYNL